MNYGNSSSYRNQPTTAHERAFNLARRFSARNENDLMQESFMESFDADEDNAGYNSTTTEAACQSLLNRHLPPDVELPTQCMRYAGFRQGLIRRDSQRQSADVAFMGMDANERIKAMTAREHHQQSPAQIKRRLTSQSPKELSSTSWF